MDLRWNCPWTALLLLLIDALLTNAAVYVSDPFRSTVVEFSSSGKRCRVFTAEQLAKNRTARFDSGPYLVVNSEDLRELSESCLSSREENSQIISFMYPGTKWCGPGNTADDYDDLGYKSDVDECCRAHDNCPETLERGECKGGICNLSPYTRSLCECDETFKRCLQRVNSTDSRLIGNLYFNIAQVSCFTYRRSCPEWMRIDFSYSWYCHQWKFTQVDRYVEEVAIASRGNSSSTGENEIPDDGNRKSVEHSKIDRELHDLYRHDADIERMMDNPKTLKK